VASLNLTYFWEVFIASITALMMEAASTSGSHGGEYEDGG
jgi:hypothetical protein